eukprot:GEMP01035522.1.p1 GENE.GEMP01035522.1~~GEMP01035522.1.p1  ORF type:complete len:423 (+),score=86.34 GEMP01035522.1:384-1652(+)
MGGKNKELKLLAYQREVTIVHNGIIEDCDGAPTLQGIVQNFAKMNKLDASDYSLLLQRRPLRYLLRKKIEVTVRLNDSTIRTVLMDIDDPITNALEATESEQFDIHHGSTNAIVSSTLSPSVIWPRDELPEDGKRAIYLKPKKRNVAILFQGEETIYAARADVALRKIMNTWCAAKRIAARFWTEEGEVAHERLKVSDISGPLKVEVMSDKVLFTITAHNDGKKSISRIRGNSMHPVQSVMEKWCELQGLSIDDCRFEWSELILTGIEFPAFLGDPASSNKEDEAPQKTSGRRSGGVLQDLISPMPIKVGVTRAGKKTPVEKPRIPGEIAPGVENIPGKKSFVSGQVTPGAVDISRKRVRRRSSVDLSEDKDEKHMTYDEWEKWDKQEEMRIKRLRKQPTVQEQINVAVALSLSEVTAQERQ